MAAYNSGIYQIKNIKNGKVYIGSSENIERRWKSHVALLNRQAHHSSHLQSAWNRYGQESFEFSILLKCSKDELLDKEQDLLSNTRPEYNMSGIAGLIEMTKLTKKKIGDALRGKPKSKEHREALSAAKLGRKQMPRTEEWKEKLRQSNIIASKKLDKSWMQSKEYKEMQSKNSKLMWERRKAGK